MPDVNNESFAKYFYSRWGKDSAIINACCKFAEYGYFTQSLSIKAARGGRESYFIDNREVVVDDDSYLILNEGQTYGSLIDQSHDVHSFAVFFQPELVNEVFTDACRLQEDKLDEPFFYKQHTGFFQENLRSHDELVSPALWNLETESRSGQEDDLKFDELLRDLLAKMLSANKQLSRVSSELKTVKSSTREELCRRLGMARDYILSHYNKSVSLEDIAAAAFLSPYHFLRLFKQRYKETPYQFLTRKRIQMAKRMLRDENLSIAEITSATGFESRQSFFRNFRKFCHCAPTDYRREWQASSSARDESEVV
ncbi:MAG: AraC family transcriptional regulator [Gammaproteobacteria bacterium]|nr:AraC family transcriptional regulator [Gammaproteobacteria bacterium]